MDNRVSTKAGRVSIRDLTLYFLRLGFMASADQSRLSARWSASLLASASG